MSAETVFIIDAVRLSLAGALVVIGLLFMIGGALGVLRFPDFYTRLHTVSVSDAVGALLLLAGLAVASWDARIAARLGLLAALMAAAGPALAHMAANAAHSGGLAPLAGPYIAPRPGAPKRTPS